MQTFRKSRLIVQFARALATTVKMSAAVSIAVPQTINIAYAQRYDLPAPYVSRALDAVLIPINHASRHRYQIPPKIHGVYVLAVAPHGIAAREGIRPGDVLATVRHQPISTPADVDRIVWASLAVSVTGFLFGVNRGPDVVEVNTNITVNNFNTNISIKNISQWTSVENRQEWTQIVDQYDDEMETSLSDTSYREDDSQAGDDNPNTDTASPDTDVDSSDDQGDSSPQNDDEDPTDSSDDDTSTDTDDSRADETSGDVDDAVDDGANDDTDTDDNASDDSADNDSFDDQDDSSDQNNDEDPSDDSDDASADTDDSTDDDTSDDDDVPSTIQMATRIWTLMHRMTVPTTMSDRMMMIPING